MSISTQVLDISDYNEEPTVANGYTLVYNGGSADDAGTSVSLSSPYILGTQTFTSIYLQTNGWIQFLNATYPTGSTAYNESIATLVEKYGVAVAWDDLVVVTNDSIGYKYANNDTQLIVNYNISNFYSKKVQFKMTINLNNHATSPGSIRIALGLIQNDTGGLFGLAYGPASTLPSGNTMNYVVSSTPTNFVYPNIPVQSFTGTANNYLTNKTIVYNIKPVSFNGFGELTNAIVNSKTLTQDISIIGYTSIGESAFQGATGVTSITIPSSVTSIGANAFKGMTGLTSITIPSSVTNIGSNAFQGSGITTAFFESSTLLDGLSMTNGPNKTLYGKSSMSICLSYYVFNGAGHLTSTIVTNNNLSYARNLTITGFSRIEANAFQDATFLTSITIPSSVTSIEANAFLNSGLTSAIFAVNTDVSRFGITLSNTPRSFFGKTGVTVSALDTKIFSGSSGLSLSGATAQLDEKTNVVIEGYTYITAHAFLNASNITSITIPDGVTYIDFSAFLNATSLTSITIPASVTFISTSSVFQNALSLTSINVDSSNTFYSSDSGVLYNFAKTTLIQYPVGNTQTSYIIPSTVTDINPYAFYGAKNLKSVTIPSASTFVSIGSNAFSHATGLTSITIPSNVTNIGSSAFQNATSLTTVNYAGISTLKIIGSNAFQNATSLTSITIPASVTSISTTSVFQNALSLTSIIVDPNNTSYSDISGVLYNNPSKNTLIQYPLGNTQTSYAIPITVTSIIGNAFYGANNLKSVTLPSASTFVSIEPSAFAGALGLTSITIPSTVTSIGSSAFLGATSLTTVTFAGTSTLKIISTGAFIRATSLTSITIPASVTTISISAFQNALSLTSINVDPSNTTYYSDSSGVLYNNPSKNTLIQYPVGNTQTSYTIPTTVTAINGYAFYGANNLKSVTLPDTSTFTSIASNAFYYATGLTSITIPPNVTAINSNAFFGATSLTTVTFSGTSKLRTISSSAFQNATSLTSITIPASVISISTSGVFQNTTSLTAIIVDPSNTSYSDISGVLYNAATAKTQLIQYPCGSSQTSYAIPSTVTSLSNVNAFNGAKNLTAITCDPNSTILSTDSFGVLYDKNKTYMYQYPCGNTRTSYTIPSTVTSMSTNPFQSVKYLKSINVDPMNTIYSSDSNGVLFNKARTILYQYPLSNTQTTYSIPLTVTNIGSSAFQYGTNLTSVTIQTPFNGTFILDYAFQNATSLKTITIPNSVTSIGFKAFQGSGLTSANFESAINYPIFAIQNKSTPQYFLGKENVVASIILPPLVLNGSGELTRTIVSSMLNNNSEVIITGYSSIETSAFQDALGVTSITIPSSVASIGSNAFQGMTGLTTITIPSSVTSIGASAFQGMTGLTTITIPSSVTSIGASAFQGANRITSVTIPSSVTSIGATVFYGMTGLTSITIPSSVTIIGANAFQTSGITSITFAVSTYFSTFSLTNTASTQMVFGKSNVLVTALDTKVLNGSGTLNSATSQLAGATRVVIESFTSIGANAFQDASGVTSIAIPSLVTSIGASAFQGMTGLTTITIPSSVTSIGASAFQGMTGLTTITIPSSVTSIGASAFQGMAGLTTITIPSSVNSIGASAFQDMTGLTTITIPSSVTSIGASAFQGMTGLTTITITSLVTSIGASAFENTALTTAFFESASTVNTLGLLNGDLINGYTVSSFYGKASVTIRYTEAIRAAIAAAPAAVISNSTFTSLLTSMDVNISNITSEVIPNTNDPYVEYSAKLTIPDGDLSTLSNVKKANIIDNVKALYAAQLGVAINKVIVTLSSGSIIVNVNVLNNGITEAMVPICFPKGTPVTTNQGVIAIEKLNPDIHTIRGKKIVAITQSRPLHKYIISIDMDAFGKKVPSAPIQISKEHKVFYKGKMVKANELVEVCEGVTRIPYSGETLYNVLMEKHDNMMINNVICETLDPKNIMAKICGGKYNLAEQDKICKELNDIIKTDNIPAYKKLYASLK